ncbi:sensor histidine kinase [Actinomadura vinacea]|uniref:sensor histidine kinase n=1 Tax=Actinomadura vinacea TaxID=115336 RepID=UPI0031E2C756
MFAVAFLCLVLPARLAVAAQEAGAAAVAAAAALFVLPLLYAVPPGRVLWARHRGRLLTAQAVLTYLPFAVFGDGWIVGLSGLLGGLLLLGVRAPASWISFGTVLAVEGVLRVGTLPADATWSSIAWAFTVPVYTALSLFGLVRLADLVTDLHRTQAELAALAVVRQRLRSAERLREAIGDRLETVTAHAEAALPMLAREPDRARGRLTEAAAVARQALDQVRSAADDRGPPETGRAGGTVALRMARLVLVAVLCAYSTQILANTFDSGTAASAKGGAAAVIVAIVALQLRHTRGRPRGWAWTLAAQTLLCFAPFQVHDELSLLGMAGFAAGSALLLLPGRWAWAAFAAVLAGVGTLITAYSPYGVHDVVYVSSMTATTGLVVYGLSRLTELARRVEAARRELARMAVAQERLRVARDTHDMLGLGLSAIALKCDLVVRLIGRDDGRAREELGRLLEIAARARGDVLSVTGAGEAHRRLSLHVELAAARDALAAAGVEVRADVPAVPVPPRTDAVLATVLREAVTNILRHSAARRCTIGLSITEEAVRLRVVNDGVPASGTTGAGGTGIGNLRARVRAVGGRLAAGPDGAGRYELAVEIPVPP